MLPLATVLFYNCTIFGKMLIPVMEATTMNIRCLAVPLCPAKQITQSYKALFTSKYIGTSAACLQQAINIMISDFMDELLRTLSVVVIV